MTQFCICDAFGRILRKLSLERVGWKIHDDDDYDDAVDYFFDQLNPSTATPMKEIYGQQRGLC